MRQDRNHVVSVSLILLFSALVGSPSCSIGQNQSRPPDEYYDPNAFSIPPGENSEETPVWQAPEEPIGTPVGQPEPTRRLTRSPQELFNAILSNNPETQLQGLMELVGEDLRQESTEVGSELRAVQLDDDPEAEFIVVVHTGYPPGTRIVVADHTPEGWNAVGTFHYWYFWDRSSAEKVVEVHAPFIMIRDSGGGSGLLSVRLAVFRLLNGTLYKTIDLVEYMSVRSVAGSRPPRGERDKSQIDFLEGASFDWKIRVTTESEIFFLGNPGETVGDPVVSNSCRGYEWAPASFSFELTDRATLAVCD